MSSPGQHSSSDPAGTETDVYPKMDKEKPVKIHMAKEAEEEEKNIPIKTRQPETTSNGPDLSLIFSRSRADLLKLEKNPIYTFTDESEGRLPLVKRKFINFEVTEQMI